MKTEKTQGEHEDAKRWCEMQKEIQRKMPASFDDAWDNVCQCYLALLEENKAYREELAKIAGEPNGGGDEWFLSEPLKFCLSTARAVLKKYEREV